MLEEESLLSLLHSNFHSPSQEINGFSKISTDIGDLLRDEFDGLLVDKMGAFGKTSLYNLDNLIVSVRLEDDPVCALK